MRTASSLFRWVLAGYLILLLNLGPSLHHAHFLGFHGGCGSESDHRSCCCHGHPQDIEGEWAVPPNEDEAVPVWDEANGCAYCKFLDQCHLSTSIPVVAIVSEAVVLAPALDEQGRPVYLIFSTARGPPSAAV